MGPKHIEGTIITGESFNCDFRTIMLFRCTKREYAESMRRGEIYLNTPRTWIEMEKKGNTGQGDLLEGTFFSAKSSDKSVYIEKLKTTAGIDSFEHNGYVFFRRRASLDTRCVCFYGLHDNAFYKEIGADGKARYTFNIPQSYFSDFSNCKNRTDYDGMPESEQDVVISIRNPHELFRRVHSALFDLGVKKEEIIISPVKYINKYERLLSTVEFPYELLLKDKRFSSQNEVRIVVNSKSPKYHKYMADHGNVISIGSIDDYIDINDYYFSDMEIERYGNRGLMFSLPQQKTMQIQDMNYFELEDLLMNILHGTVKLENGAPDTASWQDKLEFLIALFRSKYGVDVYIDENKNVFLHNLSCELLEQSKDRNKNIIEKSQFEREVESLITSRQFDTALEQCYEASKNPYLYGASQYYTGMIRKEQHDDKAAIEALLIAHDNDYKAIESLSGIASIFFNREQYFEAIGIYNRIQEEKGYDEKIWCNIGICYVKMKQYDDAIANFNKAIEKAPNDAFGHYNKGVALYMQNKYDEAKQSMETALIIEPDNDLYKSEYSKCFPVNSN